MPDSFVLDAFALMALFQDEPAGPRVQAVLQDAAQGAAEVAMSAINLGEVMYLVERRRGFPAVLERLAAFDQLSIQLVEIDRPLALAAARLKASTSMGYADCFAASLARRLGATVLTGDRDFAAVQGMVPVEWLPLAGASRPDSPAPR